MADVNQNDSGDQGLEQEPSGCGKGLKILGCGCAVMLVIGAIAVFFVVKNFRNWAANVARAGFVSAVEDLGMPEEQEQGFIHHIDRVVEAYKAEEIDKEELEQIADNILNGPFMPVAVVSIVDEKYVKPSGLPEEEKTAGRRSLQRFARGVIEKKIPEKDIDEVSLLVKEEPKDVNGTTKQQLKEKLTDEELRVLLAKIKEKADKAEIPDEAYKVDPVAEFGKAVDGVLGPENPESVEDK